VSTPTEDPDDEHVFHLYVLRSDRRDALLAHLVQAGVGAGIHYPVPVHRQAAYGDLPAVNLPATDLAAAQVLSLPMFPELTDDQIEYTVEQIGRFAG
jgi:dTDP-4-amino-4,6-dideoxygalactose transaminase